MSEETTVKEAEIEKENGAALNKPSSNTSKEIFAGTSIEEQGEVLFISRVPKVESERRWRCDHWILSLTNGIREALLAYFNRTRRNHSTDHRTTIVLNPNWPGHGSSWAQLP